MGSHAAQNTTMHRVTAVYTALFMVLTLCVATDATIARTMKSQNFTIGIQSPPSFKGPSQNIPAAHILPLTGKAGTSKNAGYLQALRKGNHINGVYGLSPVKFVASEQVFVTDLKFGTESFHAIVDTGSSDTWIVGRGFQCVDGTTGAHKNESECRFGPTYNISPTFERIPNENFNITYSDGTLVTGIFGNETVTIAGIPVYNQQIAVVEYAADVADGVSSGTIGLGFPSLTSAFAGNNPALDTKQLNYNPVISNLFRTGYVAPLFSLAIERSSVSSGTAAGGLLAIGGLPPIRFGRTFASAPFQLVTVTDASTKLATPQYQYYTIIVNGFTYERSKETNWTHPDLPSPFAPPTNKSQHQVVVDSGTTLIYLPTGIANAVNALIDPPATYDASAGVYLVNCSAKAPEFGVEIAQQTFFVNERDLIQDLGLGNGICVSGVSDAGYGPSVLGAVFLKNVLAVFDIGASKMRFAAREFY